MLWLTGRLYTSRWFLRTLVWVSPLGFLAVLAGWFTAEVGRQPWVVYGLLRTADAVSPVPGGSVLASIILFVLVYGVVFGAGLYYMAKLVSRGPDETPPVPEEEEADLRIGPWQRQEAHDPRRPPIILPLVWGAHPCACRVPLRSARRLRPWARRSVPARANATRTAMP